MPNSFALFSTESFVSAVITSVFLTSSALLPLKFMMENNFSRFAHVF
jgi:hypothetical protein